MPNRVVLECHTFDTIDTRVGWYFRKKIYCRYTCKICNHKSRLLNVIRIDTMNLLGIAFIPTAIMICSNLYNTISL